MHTSITLSAPAKLNLFLHITGRLPNGYHRLQTLFQLLDFGDTLTFEPRTSGGLTLSCSNPELENDNNLIVRAGRALELATGQTLHAHIQLTKRLPMGGGIGGGSSDCATTLHGLNQLFALNLPMAALKEIGTQLGADVPVFVEGQTAWAEGIGEHLTPIERPETWFCVIYPNVHVSTAELFSHPKLTRNTPASKIRPALAEEGHNDFEPLVRQLYPAIDEAFQISQQYGAPRLTGTGACLFMAMDNKEAANEALAKIQRQASTLSGFVARSIQTSPIFEQLRSAPRD